MSWVYLWRCFVFYSAGLFVYSLCIPLIWWSIILLPVGNKISTIWFWRQRLLIYCIFGREVWCSEFCSGEKPTQSLNLSIFQRISPFHSKSSLRCSKSFLLLGILSTHKYTHATIIIMDWLFYFPHFRFSFYYLVRIPLQKKLWHESWVCILLAFSCPRPERI